MRYTCAFIFLFYATAILWEGVLFGSFNWLPLGCLAAATGLGLFALRGWALFTTGATTALTLAIWSAEVGTGAWPHSNFTYDSVIVIWTMLWIWIPIFVYRAFRANRTETELAIKASAPIWDELPEPFALSQSI
jgi:hypothetical protein